MKYWVRKCALRKLNQLEKSYIKLQLLSKKALYPKLETRITRCLSLRSIIFINYRCPTNQPICVNGLLKFSIVLLKPLKVFARNV